MRPSNESNKLDPVTRVTKEPIFFGLGNRVVLQLGDDSCPNLDTQFVSIVLAVHPLENLRAIIPQRSERPIEDVVTILGTSDNEDDSGSYYGSDLPSPDCDHPSSWLRKFFGI